MATSNCPSCGVEYEIGEDLCPACDVELPPIVNQPSRNMTGVVLAGRYDLRKKVGAGAMGAIYLARHLALERDICVKVMHPHVAADPKLVRRFHREARAASRLEHKNIISVMDFGQDTILGAKDREEDLLYLVMEYVDGIDLSNILAQKRRLAPARAVRIIQQIAHALDEAHSKGVVHRDLKPENIMIYNDRDGEESVKVLDFGIAKIVQQDGQDTVTQLTMVGTVCGTPEYMSPEQARGKDMDGRSDLYSLGVLLYQLVTGMVPYDGDSPIEIVTQHLTSPIPNPSEKCPDLPVAVADLIRRLMEKKSDARPESAARVVSICDQVQEAIADWVPSIAETKADMRAVGVDIGSETTSDERLVPTQLVAGDESATRIMSAHEHQRRFTSTDSLDLTAKIRRRKNNFWFAFGVSVVVLGGLVALIAYKNRDSRASEEKIEAVDSHSALASSGQTTVSSSSESNDEPVSVDESGSQQASLEKEAAPAPTDTSETAVDTKPAPKPEPRRLNPATPAKVARANTARKVSPEERRAKARALEQKGDAAKNRGDCRRAVGFYQHAHRLNRSNNKLLYKTGRCYLRMGSSKARRPLQDYLKSLTPAERKNMEPRIKMMLQQVGG